MSQLRGIVDRYGVPVDGADATYDGYQNRPFEKYIEVQLWSDEPIQHLLVL